MPLAPWWSPLAAVTALATAGMAQRGPAPLWSLQPLAVTTPPTTGDARFDAHPIDRFVRSAQLAAGITPAPPADPRTLLRRLCLVLTGLPPTATEIAAFVADPSPAAFEQAIDRLLASPHHGERQARHWLDLARYSDSNGLDENLAFANAFRFRDWVVRALNQDLPFDQFGTLQLAGDLLPDDGAVPFADRIVATGFLALGPRMLAEQDKEKLVLDTVDEQLDLIGRTFLGLTVGCARCHDHKFDPISQRDYYALAGILKSTKSFTNLDHVSRWHDRELASDAQIAQRKRKEAELATAERALQAATATAVEAQRKELVRALGPALLAATSLLPQVITLDASATTATSLRLDRSQWGSNEVPVLHTHQGGPQFAEWRCEIAAAGPCRVLVRYAAKESRPMRLLVDGRVVAERALLATTGDWFPDQQQWHDEAAVELQPGAHLLRLEALSPHTPHLSAVRLVPLPMAADDDATATPPALVQQVAVGLLAQRQTTLLQPWFALLDAADDQFAAAAAAFAATHADPFGLFGALAPRSRREFAGRYQTLFTLAAAAVAEAEATPKQDGRPLQAALADKRLERVRALLFGRDGLLVLSPTALRALLPAERQHELARLEATRDACRAAVPPPEPMAMCVADGPVVDLPVHYRGDHLNLAASKTPRGFLSALTAAAPAPALPDDQSGRLQLARWLFAADNPLTPRVLVNRLWQRLFGQGLVRSPSNFGMRGDPPTHPELLDWLAAECQRCGWSQKHLLKLLLTSQTWQQASTGDGRNETIDPDNRLWWRQQRQRLDAETLRDALLVTAGTLDRAIGGSLLDTKDRDYVTNDQSADRARYDSNRRSLYLPVVRNAMYDWFTAFDYADPSVHLEQRPQSVTAPQALQLLNSPLVRRAALAFAERALASEADPERRIDWIWQQALQRTPLPAERAAVGQFLARQPADADARATWQTLCQTLLASNEFTFVD